MACFFSGLVFKICVQKFFGLLWPDVSGTTNNTYWRTEFLNVELFIGKTLGELAAQTSIFWKEIRVFVLKDSKDTIGRHLINAFTVQQIIHAYPAAATATVAFAANYYGETILRIRIVND